MPQATVHKASHGKPKHALQLLALEQELEDLGTSDPHSKMDLTMYFPPLQQLNDLQIFSPGHI